MNLPDLVNTIETTQNKLQYKALQTINQLLVVRNWLIGLYIVEFEQNGEDRAAYGKKILQNLAKILKEKGLKGFSYSNLKIFRQLYQTYPQLSEPIRNNYSQQLDDIFKQNNFIAISQIGGAQFENTEKKPENEIVGISHLGGGQFKTAGELLLNHFSFRHLTYILRIEKPIKRYFYEQQTIKCQWNAKQLGRQIETLYYERVGLSKDKKEMLQADLQQIFQDLVKQTVNDPYVFEFSGFREHHKYSENDLETALLDKIEDFMLELGHGFCFEARQKRITIDGEHDRIDLVFYHRILKCHILIDLKIRKFRKEYIGQMIYYLNYYTENMMTKHDNPPIGIILCTDKSETRVHYATSGLDQQIFISKYMVELPSEEELIQLINQTIE